MDESCGAPGGGVPEAYYAPDGYYSRNRAYFESFFQKTTPQEVAATVLRQAEALDTVRQQPDASLADLPPRLRDFYWDDFAARLAGSAVLELGAGAGQNVLLMAHLGAARVVAVDIVDRCRFLITEAAALLGLSARVTVCIGDFSAMHFAPGGFDFVIGQSVLHHLPPGIEARYLARAVALLKPEGEMRFGEPPDFDTAADTGPERGLHPLRDNRASHYEQLGRRWFDQVLVIPLERDGRIQAQTIVMRRRRGPG